jgi:hypothetical protein
MSMCIKRSRWRRKNQPVIDNRWGMMSARVTLWGNRYLRGIGLLNSQNQLTNRRNKYMFRMMIV